MFNRNGFFFQFLLLVGAYWNSEHKITVRKLTLFLVVLTLMQIAIAVVITIWSAALFNALEQRDMSGLLTQVFYLVLIFVANILVTSSHLRVKRQLMVDWREWLSERVIGRWMTNGRHYLVTHIQTAAHDNPDGRIAEDVRIATEDAIALAHSLFYSLLLLVSFTKVLWDLSGTITISLGGMDFVVYGHLVWIAFAYASAASFYGWWVGRPLVKATDSRQTMEANFRFRLAQARENSHAIALIHGEERERQGLRKLFRDVYGAFTQQTEAWAHILMFTSGYSVLSMAFPILVSAPRFITGSISLGGLMQSAQAFQHMASALSWPVDNMAGVAQWRASFERVLSLTKALDELEQEIVRPDPNRIELTRPEQTCLRLVDLRVVQLDGKILIDGLNAEISAGDRVLLTGDPWTGARLFKAIAGLWPWGSGRIELPNGDPMFFMPPRPYLPSGTLRAAICYPEPPEHFDNAALEQAFKMAGVQDLLEHLDDSESWEKDLSRQQQQRLGFVRLLLYRPKWVLLHEAFDSLDPDGEEEMLRLICQQLPDVALLTVTAQPTAEAFHNRHLAL